MVEISHSYSCEVVAQLFLTGQVFESPTFLASLVGRRCVCATSGLALWCMLFTTCCRQPDSTLFHWILVEIC